MPTAPALAVDIGGSKIAAALVDEGGWLLHRAQVPTPAGDAERVWDATERLVTAVLRHAGEGTVRGAGIGSAGPIDLSAGTVSPINIPQWRRFPLRDRLAAAVPGVPVRLAGDGLCVALGEHWRGAGRGAAFLLGMVVSTGVGGGLVLNGAPYHGRTGNAGHVGHIVVDPAGPACSCGGRGCVEAIAAGPRMAAWAQEHGWRPDPEPTDPGRPGATVADARHLAAAAAAGHPVAQRSFLRAAAALAAAIASVAAVCDLDLVIIGGGVARSGALLFDPLRAALRRHATLRHLAGLRLVPAELGTDAGLIGAAALVLPPPSA